MPDMKRLFGAVLACWALFGTAAAQTTAALTLADGSTVTLNEGDVKRIGKLEYRLGADHLWVANRGAPDNYGATTKWTAEPFYFRSAEVWAPGRRPQVAPFDGARPGARPGQWIVVEERAAKHKHVTSSGAVLPPYESSTLFHMLDGGDSLYVHLAPENDPFEVGTPLSPEAAAAGRASLDFDESMFTRYPLLEAVLGLYTLDSTLFNPAPPKRNFGWFLIPSYFTSRYPGWPFALMDGWYGFGDVNLPGDGNSNCQYGHDAWFLARGVLRDDPPARTAGLFLLEKKCALGLLDVDLPLSTCWVRGAWRGEKSGFGRRGILGVSAAKEWDEGLILGLILRPTHPLFLRAKAVRLARLTTVLPSLIWNGSGGGRQAGAYLRNLRDWHRSDVATAAEKVALKAAATAFVAHVWKVVDRERLTWNAANPTNPMRWFPNSYRPTITACWEEATLLSSLYWWAEHEGVGAARLAELDVMTAWFLERGTAWRGAPANGIRQVAYELNVVTGAAVFNAPMNGAWWACMSEVVKRRMPGTYDAIMDAIVDTSYLNIGRIWSDIDLNRPAPTPANLSVDVGSEGPGGFKMRAYAVLGARR